MTEKFRVEVVKSMRAAYFPSLSNTPEEDAWKKAESWANGKELLKKGASTRIFGRNIYPTENPEPHGYGFFITIPLGIKIEKEVSVQILAGGLYAIARCEGFETMSETWKNLWEWVSESDYKYIGETKGEQGYELGIEELINWYDAMVEKSDQKFVFNLMIQLQED